MPTVPLVIPSVIEGPVGDNGSSGSRERATAPSLSTVYKACNTCQTRKIRCVVTGGHHTICQHCRRENVLVCL
ncbi:hypothetical protein B0O99DRAFT_636253 [Bisporella sp. PMI_857]|nr:hypothetical protein B0O99DRAFT_636253 [Bisporella sp. PMI_857]